MAFITREQAGLRPPKYWPKNITPAHDTAHWGGPSPWRASNFDHARCASIWRSWQAYHMDHNGWSDIAYSSGVCPHGDVFEGRPKGIRTAANGTNVGNQMSYATCYIAGEGDPLTEPAKHGFLAEAKRLGQPLNKIHSDWYSTSCPGSELRAWVKAGCPVGAPAPDPRPEGNADALARWILGRQKYAQEILPAVGAMPDMGGGDPRWLHVAILQKAINLVSGRGLKEDGVYGDETIRAVLDFQNFWNTLKPGSIQDFPGAAGPGVRFMLYLLVKQIAEGK